MPFRSLNDTAYRVDIYDEGYTGNTITTLRAASNPFETQEDNGMDMFAPIRKQSGYLRLVYSDFTDKAVYDWRDLIPTNNKSHYVELVRVSDSSVRWCGYMKAEQYDQGLYEGVTELEFPLICPLSLIEGHSEIITDASQVGTKLNIVTVHEHMAYILGLASVTFGNLYFQADAANLPQLFCRVQKSNWMESNNDYNYQETMSIHNPLYKAKKNSLEILSDICKLFGWSLHISGKDLYFIGSGLNNEMYRCTWASLQSLTTSDLSLITTGRVIYADTVTYDGSEHNESITVGASDITVSAKLNSIDHCLELPFEDYQLETGDYIARNLGFPSTQDTEWINQISCRKSSPTNNDNRKGSRDYCFRKSKWHNESTSSGQVIENDLKITGITNNENYASYKVDNIPLANTLETTAGVWNEFTLESHEEMYFNDGYISLNATLSARPGRYPGSTYNVSSYSLKPYVFIPITLKIGDLYYNGSSWQSQATTFDICLLRGKIVESGGLVSSDYQIKTPDLANGRWIQCAKNSAALHGRVTIAMNTKNVIYGYDESIGKLPSQMTQQEREDAAMDGKACTVYHWGAINVDFGIVGIGNSIQEEKVYYEFITSDNDNHVSLNLDLHSFANTGYQKSTLLSSDFKAQGKFTYRDNSEKHPEEWLIARMKTQLTGSSRVHTITYKEQAGFGEYPLLVYEEATYITTAINHDWVNDNIQVQMIEVKDSSI